VASNRVCGGCVVRFAEGCPETLIVWQQQMLKENILPGAV
jgi:hypothetical protein